MRFSDCERGGNLSRRCSGSLKELSKFFGGQFAHLLSPGNLPIVRTAAKLCEFMIRLIPRGTVPGLGSPIAYCEPYEEARPDVATCSVNSVKNQFGFRQKWRET